MKFSKRVRGWVDHLMSQVGQPPPQFAEEVKKPERENAADAEEADTAALYFIAQEDFSPNDQLSFYENNLYKWTPESSLPSAFVASRSIKAGERVRYDSTNPDRSDLLLDWTCDSD